MAAALVDQNELASLRIEQSQLLALLKNKEGSLKSKIIRLAEILEQRIVLADPEFEQEEYRDFTISQISTYITNILRNHNIAYAPWVSECLPPKYKDPSQSNNALLNRSAKPSQWGGVDPELLLKELAAVPLEVIKQLASNIKVNAYDDVIMRLKNLIESDAVEQRYQLNDKKLRDTIRTSRPFPPRPTKYTEEVRRHGDILYQWADVVDSRCPPPPELEEDFAAGERAATEVYENFINEKYSLATGEWLERDIYRIHQSKHGAAVKDKVITLLCKECSNLSKEVYDPDDFIEMEWDWNSSTHWRCPRNPDHINGVPRGLTREQCGDKGDKTDKSLSPLETQAVNLVNNLPGYYNSLQYYNTLMQKCIATRKVKLGVDLSSKA